MRDKDTSAEREIFQSYSFCSRTRLNGMFGPKRPLPRNMLLLAHIGLTGSFGNPAVWLVGGCGARTVSRKTAFYCFHLFFTKKEQTVLERSARLKLDPERGD